MSNPKTPPTKFGLVKPLDKEPGWIDNAQKQADAIRWQLHGEKISLNGGKVICEMPQAFLGNAGGMAAAQTGSILKLSVMIGIYAREFLEHSGASFQVVPVRQWKGQLPKEVVIQRIRKYLGEKNCKEFKADVWDAVGIGLWAMGVKL